MPKQSSRRQKGIKRGIPRHLVKGKDALDGQNGSNDESGGSRLLCFSKSKLTAIGKKYSDILSAVCEKFRLIGFTRAQNGEYVPLSHRDKIRHYITIVCCLALSMQKTWGTAQMFLYEELRVESFMCLGITLTYISTVLLALGVVLRPKETMDLHNSWAQISDCVKKMDPGSNSHPLDNTSACLKVISNILVTQGIAVAVAMCSLLMDELPTLLFPMAKRSGLLPDGILPNWAWQLMFAPLEWLMVQPFVLLSAFSCNFLYMEHGVLDVYLRQLRKINVNCMRSRRKVEQMYVQLELFNRIGQVWIRFFLPPWLVDLSSTVIVTTFISIRYTDLPSIVYIFFPYIGASFMVVIFWQCYDMFHTIRASENILSELWKHEAPYFRGMTRAKRIEKMKRAKAMRPLVFSVADSEFSLNLPINAWDEILNQILFLLSL